MPKASCTNTTDILKAGSSIVIQNDVAIPRSKFNFDYTVLYDGGDVVMASYPITMTRGAYCKNPGSVLAGAVEILDTDNWGTEFVVPIGENSTRVFDNQIFFPTEVTTLFAMAGEDGTVVVSPSGVEHYVSKGLSVVFNVKMGDKITSNKPMQAHMLTGDKSSNYEMRWFSLISVSEWSDDYVTPVGDRNEFTKVVLYNNGDFPIDVQTTMRKNDVLETLTTTVGAKKYNFSPTINANSGAQLKSKNGEKFIALSFTDIGFSRTNKDTGTNAEVYDWGFPVVPRGLLTPQVLIGWGYGCTNNNCQGNEVRSPVWVTPLEDADIYVDYRNIGMNYEKISAKKFESIRITDKSDTDMSGAIIFAVKQGEGENGTTVDIAAAWGQDPFVSGPRQDISLDLGTVVLPYSGLRVSKTADKVAISVGETLRYTIRVSKYSMRTKIIFNADGCRL